MNSKHRLGRRLTVWAITVWEMMVGVLMRKQVLAPKIWNGDGCLSAPIGN